MSRSSFTRRHRHLILAVATALLLGLLASMALAATAHRSHAGGYGYGGHGGYSGYGYGGYGYGYGYGGATRFYPVVGTVYDAQSGARLPGASVTLQRSSQGGPWVTVPPTETGNPNPMTSDQYGNFGAILRSGGSVRVTATAPGYDANTSAPAIARLRGVEVDVRLTAFSRPEDTRTTTTATTTGTTGDGGRTVTTTTVPATQGAGSRTAAPVPVGRPAGCAAKRGSARAACERAARLATALRSCTKAYKKGSKRTLCERRARALSACDARTGRKRSACRTRALRIGKTTKKHKAASRHAARR